MEIPQRVPVHAPTVQQVSRGHPATHAPQAIKSGFDKAKEVVVGKPDDKDGKPKKDEKKAAAK